MLAKWEKFDLCLMTGLLVQLIATIPMVVITHLIGGDALFQKVCTVWMTVGGVVFLYCLFSFHIRSFICPDTEMMRRKVHEIMTSPNADIWP